MCSGELNCKYPGGGKTGVRVSSVSGSHACCRDIPRRRQGKLLTQQRRKGFGEINALFHLSE